MDNCGTRYDEYNREERSLCAHLFRLLHEGLWKDPENSYLKAMVDRAVCNLTMDGNRPDIRDAWHNADLGRAAIFTEVALVRDAVWRRRVSLEAVETRVTASLPLDVEQKAGHKQRLCQGLLSTKPDLVISFPNLLLVFEAKLTLPFDRQQLNCTRELVRTWMQLPTCDSGLPLWHDLGVSADAAHAVLTLGNKHYAPDLSWQEILDIMVSKGFPQSDRAWVAFHRAVALLKEAKRPQADRTFPNLRDVGDFALKGNGGLIGYKGGFARLDMDVAERPKELAERKFKWIDAFRVNEFNVRNWLDLEAFIRHVHPVLNDLPND